MAREEFFDRLRAASRILQPGSESDSWLTTDSVQGFDPEDFADWPQETRRKLAIEVDAFLAIAHHDSVRPISKSGRKAARKHLEEIVKLVGGELRREWLAAQSEMMHEAANAAKARNWHVEEDKKEVLESLLGDYQAPRLRIRTPNNEVVLDPVARFGSGRRGVVDLVRLPTYETVYLLTYKEGDWRIVSRRGTGHSRPFLQATLVNTITKLPHA